MTYEMIQDVAASQGWTEATTVIVLCQYIDNLRWRTPERNDADFREFLTQKVEEEEDND